MSTSHAVMELIEEISNATDNKKHAIGVFIDLKKAFDQWTMKYLSKHRISMVVFFCGST